MIEISVTSVPEGCCFCDDPREISFTYENDDLAVRKVAYHHELKELVTFADALLRLDKERSGEARLVSKNEDSEFRIRFLRTGGPIRYSARHVLTPAPDERDFAVSASYLDDVPSENVGLFFSKLHQMIRGGQQTGRGNE